MLQAIRQLDAVERIAAVVEVVAADLAADAKVQGHAAGLEGHAAQAEGPLHPRHALLQADGQRLLPRTGFAQRAAGLQLQIGRQVPAIKGRSHARTLEQAVTEVILPGLQVREVRGVGEAKAQLRVELRDQRRLGIALGREQRRIRRSHVVRGKSVAVCEVEQKEGKQGYRQAGAINSRGSRRVGHALLPTAIKSQCRRRDLNPHARKGNGF